MFLVLKQSTGYRPTEEHSDSIKGPLYWISVAHAQTYPIRISVGVLTQKPLFVYKDRLKVGIVRHKTLDQGEKGRLRIMPKKAPFKKQGINRELNVEKTTDALKVQVTQARLEQAKQGINCSSILRGVCFEK